MAFRIPPDEFERYAMSDNCVGVVDCHEQHVLRVAEILSERFPGIVFLWDVGGRKSRTWTICAVRPNRRRLAGSLEEKIVAAGENIAERVASKYPVKRRGLLGLLFGSRLRPGWHYTEPKS